MISGYKRSYHSDSVLSENQLMCVSIVPLSRVLPLLSSFQTYYLSWFKAGLEKEYYETTLPARLEKFEALLKSRDEGKGFFLGDKVRARCAG